MSSLITASFGRLEEAAGENREADEKSVLYRAGTPDDRKFDEIVEQTHEEMEALQVTISCQKPGDMDDVCAMLLVAFSCAQTTSEGYGEGMIKYGEQAARILTAVLAKLLADANVEPGAYGTYIGFEAPDRGTRHA